MPQIYTEKGADLFLKNKTKGFFLEKFAETEFNPRNFYTQENPRQE